MGHSSEEHGLLSSDCRHVFELELKVENVRPRGKTPTATRSVLLETRKSFSRPRDVYMQSVEYFVG